MSIAVVFKQLFTDEADVVVKPCSEGQPAGLMLGKGVLLRPDDLNLIQIRSPKNLKIPMLKKKTDRENPS